MVVKGLPSPLAFLFQSPEGGLGLWSSGYDTALHGVDRGFESHRAHFVVYCF